MEQNHFILKMVRIADKHIERALLIPSYRTDHF